MEEKTTMIPLIVYESMLDKEDRQQKRLIAVIILLIVLFVASNALWVYEWNQYDYVTDSTEVEIDSEGAGVANYIGDDGEIYNGKDHSEKENDEENKERNKRNEEA